MQDLRQAGKYEILERIGEGGFGVVYKGRDPFIKRLVAIKTCTSGSEETRRRFLREAEIAGNIEHTNITVVYDFGFQDNVPYLVQEFLSGEDLDHLIERRENLSLVSKLDCLLQAAQGLGFAHEQGITHRDIKPSNLRVLEDGRVKIMDFGIAKVAGVDTQLTQTGTTLGTPAYLSPEQLRGDAVDNRSDIYSFGVLAFELLTYRRLFDADTISSLFYQILHQTPTRVRELWPDVPQAVDDLLAQCVAKAADGRPPTFAPIVQTLEQAIAELQEQPDCYLETAADLPPAAGADPEKLRQEAMTKARNHIENLLAIGNLDAASRALLEAQEDFGDQVPFRTLHARLQTMQTDGEETDVYQAPTGPPPGVLAQEPTAAAATSSASDDSTAAATGPEETSAEDPEEAAEAAAMQEELEEAVLQTREFLLDRQLTRAEEHLDDIKQRFGEVPQIIAVSRQIKLKRQLQDGRSALATGDLRAARDYLNRAGDIDPEDTELLHLRDRLLAAEEEPLATAEAETIVPGLSRSPRSGSSPAVPDTGSDRRDSGAHEVATVGEDGRETPEAAPADDQDSGDLSEQPTVLTSWDEIQRQHEAIAAEAARKRAAESAKASMSGAIDFDTAEVLASERPTQNVSEQQPAGGAPPEDSRGEQTEPNIPALPPGSTANPASTPAPSTPDSDAERPASGAISTAESPPDTSKPHSGAISTEVPATATPSSSWPSYTSVGRDDPTWRRWLLPAALLVGALLVLWFLLSMFGGADDAEPGTSTEPGTVLLDAHPWAVLEGATNIESGTDVDLLALGLSEASDPSARSTPLRLQLPAGDYRFKLRHLDQERQLEVQVEPSETNRQHVRFEGGGAAEYLEELGIPARRSSQ